MRNRKLYLYFITVGFLSLASCGGDDDRAQKDYEQAIANNHADIKVVTMPVKLQSCPNNFVQQHPSYNLSVPMSAAACVGFLASFYDEYPNIYQTEVIKKVALNADKTCKYQQAIDLSAKETKSYAAQYRIGQLHYSGNFNSIMNAMRARDFEAASVFRFSFHRFKDVCLNVLNHARASYFQ